MIYTAAWIVFLLSYAVFAIGRLPGTKIERPAMAFIGAVLMFAVGALKPREAIASLDFQTLVLLFSMMAIVAILHLDGLFEWIAAHIVTRLDQKHLLPGVIFTSGILSAFLVNDVVCLFLAPLVLRVCRHMGRNPLPFLLALATASNIGSTATITGNPQNILIGSVSHISYRDFLFHLGPVAAIGLFLDWGVIATVCRKQLKEQRPVADGDPPSSINRLGISLLVVAGIITAFLAGINPALVAALGAALLLALCSHKPKEVYDEIDWSLLVLFVGLFLILGAAQEAGIAGRLLSSAERWNLHSLAIFSTVVTLLSNLVSNVPAVMLLKELIPHYANAHQAWLALAMVSTLAGNLTITGSIANIIVVERAKPEVTITFKDYLAVGLPTTMLTIAAGALWIAFVMPG